MIQSLILNGDVEDDFFVKRCEYYVGKNIGGEKADWQYIAIPKRQIIVVYMDFSKLLRIALNHPEHKIIQPFQPFYVIVLFRYLV